MSRALLLAGHGSRDAAAQRVSSDLAALVRAELPGVPVHLAYLDHAAPTVPDELGRVVAEYGDTTVVPLLFAPGRHADVDLPALVARSRARLTPPLGAHPLVAAALRDRLLEAGTSAEATVLVAAAGSRDPRAIDVTAATAALLAEGSRWETHATTVADIEGAVTRARDGGRPVAIAPLLLGPGAFLERLRAAGADVVAEPLGSHRSVALLVALRYVTALSEVAA